MNIDNKVYVFLLNELKNSLISAKYPADFKHDFDFYKDSCDDNFGFFYKYSIFNCYAYAMQFKIDLETKIRDAYGKKLYYSMYQEHKIPSYQPGFLSLSKPNMWTYDSLVNAFYNDCHVLGIKTSKASINEPLEIDSYKIALMLEKTSHEYKDFHFIRQNYNGSWSEKCGYSSRINSLSSPNDNKDYEIIEIVKIKKPKYVK